MVAPKDLLHDAYIPSWSWNYSSHCVSNTDKSDSFSNQPND
jgi:hypothetical protein